MSGVGGEIPFGDAVAIAGVGEIETEHWGVAFGLLETGGGIKVLGFGFNNGNGEGFLVAEKVVRFLAALAAVAVADKDDLAVGKVVLFLDAPGRAAPSTPKKGRRDVDATGVGLVEGVRAGPVCWVTGGHQPARGAVWMGHGCARWPERDARLTGDRNCAAHDVEMRKDAPSRAGLQQKMALLLGPLG